MNADKSKEVVFNSNGKQFLNTFKCANCTLETVNFILLSRGHIQSIMGL